MFYHSVTLQRFQFPLQFLYLVFLVGICLVTGCDKSSKNVAKGKIRIQLNWFPDAQHGGFYAALINGYYEDEGLDVEILPGGPGASVESKVDFGRVEFGIANAHRILLKRNEGARITAVFAAFQNSPRCIMVHEETGIQSFSDLYGVTLAVGSDAAFYKFMQNEVELKNVKLVSYSGSSAKFLADKSYAQQAYSISEPLLAKRKGAKPVTLMLSDLGFNPYTSCLITSEKMIEENPELVRKFVRATQKGWSDYLQSDEAEKSNLVMEKFNKEHDIKSLNWGAVESRKLIRPQPNTIIGSMSSARWTELIEQLKTIEMLKKDFKIGRAFTTEFLPTDK